MKFELGRMNHDRHHSLVVDAIEAAISGSPGEEFLRAWFNKFRLSEIKEEDAEAELYKRQHSKGTGKQDLDIHGLKAEEMLLKRADEFAFYLGKRQLLACPVIPMRGLVPLV